MPLFDCWLSSFQMILLAMSFTMMCFILTILLSHSTVPIQLYSCFLMQALVALYDYYIIQCIYPCYCWMLLQAAYANIYYVALLSLLFWMQIESWFSPFSHTNFAFALTHSQFLMYPHLYAHFPAPVLTPVAATSFMVLAHPPLWFLLT